MAWCCHDSPGRPWRRGGGKRGATTLSVSLRWVCWMHCCALESVIFCCRGGRGSCLLMGFGVEAAICGVPKRRRCVAAVILGRRGHSLLGCYGHRAFFFQAAREPKRKIFIDIGAGSMAGGAPSGLFPGGGAGSRAWRSLRCGGEDNGLDGVCNFVSKVFSVKQAALFENPLSSGGLLVILYPPFF